METVWIAGGAGFIGSHLCSKLLSQNYHVVCLDNFITSNKSNIAPLLSNPNFQLVEQDISSLSSLGPGHFHYRDIVQ